MIIFRPVRLVASLLAVVVLTVVGAPAASAKTNAPSEESVNEEAEIPESVLMTLNAIGGHFNCENSAWLPWCR